MHSLHAYMHDFNKRKIDPIYDKELTSFIIQKQPKWILKLGLSDDLFILQTVPYTFVIILKMFFQKLSFIVKIVFVTLCSVRKMDVSLLCFKTFFGALYIQATTCALDVHLHKVFLIIWSNDLLNGVYECYGSLITNKLWSYLVLQTGTTYKHDELCTTQ